MKNSEMIGKIAICDLLTTINEQGIGGGCVLYAWAPERICEADCEKCIKKWLNEEVRESDTLAGSRKAD